MHQKERRDQDHHWFNLYAVKDRVLGLHLAEEQPLPDIATLPLSTFLPNIEDCINICKEFIILVARVLLRYFPWFECLKPEVPSHIPHPCSDVMSSKSEIVNQCKISAAMLCCYV